MGPGQGILTVLFLPGQRACAPSRTDPEQRILAAPFSFLAGQRACAPLRTDRCFVLIRSTRGRSAFQILGEVP